MNNRADYLKFLADNAKPIVVPPPKSKEKVWKDLYEQVPAKFNVPPDFRNKRVVFSGTLKSMVRDAASKLVYSCGGQVQDSMRRGTEYLVVPDNFKHNTAKAKLAVDYGVEIMTESVFLATLRKNKLWNS